MQTQQLLPPGRSARSSGVARAAGRTAVRVQAAALPVDAKAVKKLRLRALSDSALAIGIYPRFAYNASGGGGVAVVQPDPTGTPGLLRVKFDASTLNIPPMCWQTASLFNIPIPPPLNIAIQPSKLEGTINVETGEAQLDFESQFVFTAGSLYKAPPMLVRTLLSTGSAKGQRLEGQGAAFDKDFRGKLVGVATVEPTGDGFLDGFLMLPNDALAVMSAELMFE